MRFPFLKDVESKMTAEMALRKVRCSSCNTMYKVSHEEMEFIVQEEQFICEICKNEQHSRVQTKTFKRSRHSRGRLPSDYVYRRASSNDVPLKED